MTASTNPSRQGFVSTPIVPAPTLSVQPKPGWPTDAHLAAKLFPLMKEADLGLLVDDIVEHGLREPILVYQGLILDGRNRLRACELAGVEPRFVEWDGVGSPLAIVLSRNLHRRHLNEGQRAIIAARAKGMFEDEAAERKRAAQFGHDSQSPAADGGDREKSPENAVAANLQQPGRATAKAAELLNVSERSVFTASRVLKSADEQVIAAVESGDIAVSDAASIANLPKDDQRQALDAKRAGRARTLRQAAEVTCGVGVSPASDQAGGTPAPQFSRKRLLGDGKRLSRDIEKLFRSLDSFTAACGGPNLYTSHIHDCLTALLRTIEDCVKHVLRLAK
jgi:ParB-like chromosome segregation protein Spo0J